MVNPFSPVFGRSPYVLAGRTALVEDLERGFDDGPGSPTWTVLFSGARGMGKTVMLNHYEDIARTRGWLVITEAASSGLLERLSQDHLPRLLRQYSGEPSTRVSGVQVSTPLGGGSVTWSDRFPAESSLRHQIEQLTDALAVHETGLAITVDEIQGAVPEELRKLGEIVQFARREGRSVAFAAAGLPASLDELLNDNVITFLRRAERLELRSITVEETRDAMAETIRDSGRDISSEALHVAATATTGYPFLIQLVGYRTWNQRPDDYHISLDDVTQGVSEAITRLGDQVHRPTFVPLSNKDRDYLMAMAQDAGPADTGAVAERLHVAQQYANVYRTRLLAAGVIESDGWGRVRFALPYMREWLLKQG
jgi:hypothetical protein